RDDEAIAGGDRFTHLAPQLETDSACARAMELDFDRAAFIGAARPQEPPAGEPAFGETGEPRNFEPAIVLDREHATFAAERRIGEIYPAALIAERCIAAILKEAAFRLIEQIGETSHLGREGELA